MIKLLEGLSIQTGLPVDDRSIAKTFEERDNIPETVRYLGMKVYVEDAKKEYTLREGLSNDFWAEVRAIALSSELITDPDHLTVTQDEKDWWDSKAEGKHTHTKKEITDFPSSIKNPNSITISLDGTSQGAYDGSAVKNINITPENINASRNNHTHTKNQITDFPASLKNPTAITIQANGSYLGSYDGSAAKTFNLTATNVGAYTKAETNNNFMQKHLGNINKATADNVNLPDGFYNVQDNLISGYGGYFNLLSWGFYSGGTSGARAQLAVPYQFGTPTNSELFLRVGESGSWKTPWRKIWNDGNFNPDSKANVHDHPYLSLSGGTMNEGAEIKGICGGGTDYWFIKGGGTGDNGYMEIGTRDNGTEPIYVRQYNTSSTISHSITLMDVSGDQRFNNVNASKIYNAVWNDYAEFFERGEETEVGDIIALDESSDKEQYIKATVKSKVIAGVQSDTFAHLIGGENPTTDEGFYEYNIKKYIPIGLAGRVKVKVIGTIKKGDYITISPFDAGVGISLNNHVDKYGWCEGRIIGQALESKDTENIGLIKMLIK